MVPSTFVPSGYVKCEGGTVNRANYPRLVALADTYSLWTDDPTNNPGLFGKGNGSTTMVLPNWTGRMAQLAATAGGAVAAGLPDIKGRVVTWNSNLYGVFYNGSGAFALEDAVPRQGLGSGTASPDCYTAFVLNASSSNPIYGSSTTVQPPAINVFAIMRY